MQSRTAKKPKPSQSFLHWNSTWKVQSTLLSNPKRYGRTLIWQQQKVRTGYDPSRKRNGNRQISFRYSWKSYCKSRIFTIIDIASGLKYFAKRLEWVVWFCSQSMPHNLFELFYYPNFYDGNIENPDFVFNPNTMSLRWRLQICLQNFVWIDRWNGRRIGVFPTMRDSPKYMERVYSVRKQGKKQEMMRTALLWPRTYGATYGATKK